MFYVEPFLRVFSTEFDMHVFRYIQILGLRFARQICVAILRKANNIKMKLEKKTTPQFFFTLCLYFFSRYSIVTSENANKPDSW